MRKQLIVWVIAFISTFAIIITYNKFLGGMLSASRAYSWEKIIDNLPVTIFLSVVMSFAIVYWYNQDRKK